MLMVCSTCSCASACGGNNARETLRSVPVWTGEGGWFPSDGEGASPNARELDSASLRFWRSANLPEMVKPAIVGEAADGRTRRAARGGWRERAPKEHIRYPGDPLRSPDSADETGQGIWGRHNPDIRPRQWKSDWPIVALKRGNSRGAKGPDRRRVFTAKVGAA